MPFKHNAARRHRIPRARYRVTTWATCEAGVRRWGDLIVWVDEVAPAGWQAPRRSTPGGQPRYSDLAIELVLSLRLVFHLALRQAEGFARSVLAPLDLDLAVPDHTTLSRRGQAFAGRQPRVRAGTWCWTAQGLSCSAKASNVWPRHGPAAPTLTQAAPWRRCHHRRDRSPRADRRGRRGASARPAAPAGGRPGQPDRGRRLRP